MQRFRVVLCWALLAALPFFCNRSLSAPAADQVEPIAATVQTTLSTASGQIRQFVFDGDSASYFASEQKPGAADHLTLVFDRPVELRSVRVVTGKPEGGERLDAGALEGSADGKTFTALAAFAEGVARGEPKGASIQAIRIKPPADLKHALVVREITVESNPPVAVFKYPVEIAVDVTDAPEMKEWAENVARICERAYPMLNEELKSDGFKPRHQISMRLRSDYQGVAAASGGRITGSVKFFKEHPEDVGAMVHETTHVVQAYRSRNNPGWLVEGVADYVRFYKFEPGKIRRPNPRRARYNASYQVTAHFLAYVCDKYDPHLVRKLNAVMRAGQYEEKIFKDLTGKTVQELGEEWRRTIAMRRV